MPLTDDWHNANITLQNLAKHISDKGYENLRKQGEYVKETLVNHIDRQDLNWTPLSPDTIRLKGNDIIYVESGFLKSNLTVRGIKSSKARSTIIIGANSYITHPNGMKLSTLMNMLEYGTMNIPPRPLLRPTWNEVKPKVVSKLRTGCIGDIKELIVK